MALSLIILAIALASFALGISFADIRAEVRASISGAEARRDRRVVTMTLVRDAWPHSTANIETANRAVASSRTNRLNPIARTEINVLKVEPETARAA